MIRVRKLCEGSSSSAYNSADTVRDFLMMWLDDILSDRLAYLERSGAPDSMIEKTDAELQVVRDGDMEVGGDMDVLDEPFKGFVSKKGYSGNEYLQINGNINFYPNARYGYFIKRV